MAIAMTSTASPPIAIVRPSAADRALVLIRSRQLQQRSHALIPGGAHTYAKGDDQFPQHAPAFIARGKGCHVWDVDGNEFTEYGSGLRSIILGHAHEPVTRAVTQALSLGVNFTRPHALEVEAAERVLSVIDADMIKFAKHGSDATTAAVKLSRAHTGRDLVAICGDHPFFSTDDWFIGTTAMNAGIPQTARDQTVKFRYNDPDSLRELFERHPNQIACVIMEAENGEPPKDGYFQAVQDLCRQHGAVFVLDEIITGFRWHLNGAQKMYGIKPDLCCFGKGIANGFSVSALCGKREIMELGGLKTERRRVFLLSTTHGGETHALAACIASIDEYRRNDPIGRLWAQGRRLEAGVNKIIGEHKIGKHFHLTGKPCSLIYVTKDARGNRSQEFRTLFLQELIKRRVIAPNLFVNAAHEDADIDRTVEAIGESLEIYKKALEDGVERYLEGRPVKPVAREYN